MNLTSSYTTVASHQEDFPDGGVIIVAPEFANDLGMAKSGLYVIKNVADGKIHLKSMEPVYEKKYPYRKTYPRAILRSETLRKGIDRGWIITKAPEVDWRPEGMIPEDFYASRE